MAGITNDLSSQLSRYYQKRNNTETPAAGAEDIFKKLKTRQQSIAAAKPADQTPAAETEDSANISAESQADANPIERRKKELQAIINRLNAEEAQKNAAKNGTTDANGMLTVNSADAADLSNYASTMGFINDMPLFDEFKSGLIDAFKLMDSGTQGIVNAQYELNYSSMQYIMDANGSASYKETNFSVKLDLNYIKAAAGGSTGAQIADAIEQSTDFASMLQNLQKVGQANQPGSGKGIDVEALSNSMQDYFSPKNTANRILDFATSFFELSDAYKKNGDTEAARNEFAEMMKDAVQKGFDQALGSLGKLDQKTQDSIDETHDLIWKGFDDFIKNGLNKDKKEQGIYSALEQFSLNFQMSYSEKTVAYNPSGMTYSEPVSSLLNTQA